jgi:hypothetical protein
MLTDESKNQLLSGLESGGIAPKLLFYDQDLKNLSGETARFFEEHYESAGIGSIWRRK